MTIGSILLGAALVIVVALFLARPLLQATREEQNRLSQQQILLAEKETILTQIRNLDFDHDTGKMPDEIHEHQRAQLMNSAADILRQLEEMAGKPVQPAVQTGDETSIDDDIEAAVARIRQAKQMKRAAPSRTHSTNGGGFCPNCGKPVDAGDNFCVSCGHKLHTKQKIR
jgi:RNA polymerase-binding transcription factor DksA